MSTIRTNSLLRSHPSWRNLLIENDIFLNPVGVVHNPIIRGVYRERRHEV